MARLRVAEVLLLGKAGPAPLENTGAFRPANLARAVPAFRVDDHDVVAQPAHRVEAVAHSLLFVQRNNDDRNGNGIGRGGDGKGTSSQLSRPDPQPSAAGLSMPPCGLTL